MENLYWILYLILGYVGCGLLTMFLSPLGGWIIDRYAIGDEIFFEKSTYSTKWKYTYSDIPQIVVASFWPLFAIFFLILWCKNLPKMIKYHLRKRQRYIDFINEKVAKIIGE